MPSINLISQRLSPQSLHALQSVSSHMSQTTQTPSQTDSKAPPRVFTCEGMGKVPPEPKNPQAWRAPRMGNAPMFISGNMHSVCQEIVRYGLRSRAVASRSFETTNYPRS